VLRQYVVDAPIAQLEGHAARSGELARLVPALADRVLGVPAPRPADAETERFRLFEAVANLLESASSSSPILVVLDDLQWADRSALLLLKYLARGRGSARIMLLGTYRDTELDRQHPLWETVADLRREPHFTRLALAGLDRESVAELLRAAGHRGDHRTRAGLAGVLRQETAGNPFFVGEIVRHLLESGAEVETVGVAHRQQQLDAQLLGALLALEQFDRPRVLVGGRLVGELREGAVGGAARVVERLRPVGRDR